jgi:hypothetical protein
MVQLSFKNATASGKTKGTADGGEHTIAREVAQIEPGGRNVGHGSQDPERKPKGKDQIVSGASEEVDDRPCRKAAKSTKDEIEDRPGKKKTMR